MKNYYRIMLGRGSMYAAEARAGNFVGVDFLSNIDLTDRLPEDWRESNKKLIPEYLKENPNKSKVAAGLACANTWTVAKYLKNGDIVLCPDGSGTYMIGEIVGGYEYKNGEILPHRRNVAWVGSVERTAMSQSLQNSAGSIGTVSNVSGYAAEIDSFITNPTTKIVSTDETVEDPSVFALEKHLEDFLVHNWAHTELGKKYDIYEQDGEIIGQQYPSDTGPIDILAISKDKKELLVVELKKGRINDVVVGQIQRYMGYVKDELAEKGQDVKGVIIALEDSVGLQRALSVTTNIDFMTYKVRFSLEKK
jgi:restriction system protein